MLDMTYTTEHGEDELPKRQCMHLLSFSVAFFLFYLKGNKKIEMSKDSVEKKR